MLFKTLSAGRMTKEIKIAAALIYFFHIQNMVTFPLWKWHLKKSTYTQTGAVLMFEWISLLNSKPLQNIFYTTTFLYCMFLLSQYAYLAKLYSENAWTHCSPTRNESHVFPLEYSIFIHITFQQFFYFLSKLELKKRKENFHSK